MQKYQRIYKDESDQWFAEHKMQIEESKRDRFRLRYHIMPEIGWLNDPNGLCQKDGVHHFFYQYCPYHVEGDFKTWGHVSTRDFVHYTNHEIAIYPDTEWDQHGAYSGSAFLRDDQIHFFYTGNVKLFDREDYDYIKAGRLSNTIHCMSRDGIRLSEKKLLLTNEDYPNNISNHIRDPKILEYQGKYYMVQGARDLDDKGCVVLFESEDLIHWSYFAQFTTDEPFGYMWECPDLFQLDGNWILLLCPQGVPQNGLDYANIYQSVAMFLDIDFQKKQFRVVKVQQLDRGFDFYAQQTYEDDQKRRIMIGWMGMPDADYGNPTVESMWQHALTIPRQLEIRQNHLYQIPLVELEALRKEEYCFHEDEWNQSHCTWTVYELVMRLEESAPFELSLRNGCNIHYDGEILTLYVVESGSGRTERSVKIQSVENIHVYSDQSSLEIFINDGAYVFTTRVYCSEEEHNILYHGKSKALFQIYPLRECIF